MSLKIWPPWPGSPNTLYLPLRVLSDLLLLLAFANRTPRRTFVVGEAPAHVLDDRLFRIVESIVVLATPVVDKAVHVGLLLVVLHPLQEEAATHGERVLKDLEHDVWEVPLRRETHGLVAVPRGIHARILEEQRDDAGLPVVGSRIQSVEPGVLAVHRYVFHRVDVSVRQDVVDDVDVPAVDRPVERIRGDGDVGELIDDSCVDVPVAALDCSEEDAFVGVDLVAQSEDDFVVMAEGGVPHFRRCDLRSLKQEEFYDLPVPALARRGEKGASPAVLFVVDARTTVLEETIGEEAASVLDCPSESVVDALRHGGMRACEDLFHLVHAVLADEVGELVGVVLRLDLAKRDVLVGGAIHGAHLGCDFREVECNELAYELHVRLMHFGTDHDVFV